MWQRNMQTLYTRDPPKFGFGTGTNRSCSFSVVSVTVTKHYQISNL